ncbi:MAG: copper(I)-binding protein [Myxococcota bacterium]
MAYVRSHSWFIGFATFICLSLGCSDQSPSAAPAAAVKPAAGIEVYGQVSHPSAGAPVGVIYMSIRNGSSVDDRLIRVETHAAKNAELHETTVSGDMVRMKHQTDGFVLPAGDRIEFASGGKHVMLSQLAQPLVEGMSLDVTLVFEHAAPILIAVPVRARM